MLSGGSGFVGRRHSDTCLCGCVWVAGLPGEPVQDSDTPKLAKLGLIYMRFMVPLATGGEREKVVCYDLSETYEQLELAA